MVKPKIYALSNMAKNSVFIMIKLFNLAIKSDQTMHEDLPQPTQAKRNLNVLVFTLRIVDFRPKNSKRENRKKWEFWGQKSKIHFLDFLKTC